MASAAVEEDMPSESTPQRSVVVLFKGIEPGELKDPWSTAPSRVFSPNQKFENELSFRILAVFWCCGALRKEKEGGGGEGERGEEEERGKEGGGERREGGRRDFTTVFLPITTCNIDTSE